MCLYAWEWSHWYLTPTISFYIVYHLFHRQSVFNYQSSPFTIYAQIYFAQSQIVKIFFSLDYLLIVSIWYCTSLLGNNIWTYRLLLAWLDTLAKELTVARLLHEALHIVSRNFSQSFLHRAIKSFLPDSSSPMVGISHLFKDLFTCF